MIYAETDFLLALIKQSDWLKSNAQKIYDENKNEIETSLAAVIEVAIVSERLGLDVENVINSIFGIANVRGLSLEEGVEAAHLIKDENVGVFDAFHAVLSKDNTIVSSDHVYDKIGKPRIKLESDAK